MYKTDFAGIKLTDTWLDQASNLETARNIFSKREEKELRAKSTSPLLALAIPKFANAPHHSFSIQH